jgi:hypothetical protein
MKKAVVKGVALVTLVAGAVALAQALKRNKKARVLKAAARDAKEHVLAHAKTLSAVSKKSFAKIVDTVLAEYAGMRTLTKKEVIALSDELKAGWEETSKTLKKKG